MLCTLCVCQKRPLGELESRYQYTPPQPVLSCRTVDIDVSGTRTYRPRSSTDILAEQQKLIHRLFRNGRYIYIYIYIYIHKGVGGMLRAWRK